jgi:hypothetical protein
LSCVKDRVGKSAKQAHLPYSRLLMPGNELARNKPCAEHLLF